MRSLTVLKDATLRQHLMTNREAKRSGGNGFWRDNGEAWSISNTLDSGLEPMMVTQESMVLLRKSVNKRGGL